MTSNKLMVNTNKTEIVSVDASSCIRLVDSDSADIGGSNIPFKPSVRCLGVKSEETLSMQDCRPPLVTVCLLSDFHI